MKISLILFGLITAPFLIVGCGGGSSSGSSSETTLVAKISGTVPGTLIEAFCADGTYARVASTQNGTNEHPFEIIIPANVSCRLVMTTNENDPANRIITPIGFSNGTTLVLDKDLNLGNIPLELNYANADDKDGDHVVDTPLVVNAHGATTNNSNVQDRNQNGIVDSYDDDDDDNIVNAYEDDDNDGKANIYDDDDGNSRPDYIDDDDKDGLNNHDDTDDNGDGIKDDDSKNDDNDKDDDKGGTDSDHNNHDNDGNKNDNDDDKGTDDDRADHDNDNKDDENHDKDDEDKDDEHHDSDDDDDRE